MFRVDMRLRPYGDSGPLVMSLEMLENYLHTQGREWERYAWVKAREITGSRRRSWMRWSHPSSIGATWTSAPSPACASCTRRSAPRSGAATCTTTSSWDPAASARSSSSPRCFRSCAAATMRGCALRPTLATLACLAQRRLLPADAVEQLRAAYVFLRNLEHRLQYLEDQQTQMLPAQPRRIWRRWRGPWAARTPRSCVAALEHHRNCVTRQFEAVFAGTTTDNGEHPLAGLWTGSMSGEEAQARLRALGYQDAARVFERVRELRESATYRRMSASTQARVDKLVPRLLEVAAAFEHPGATLERLARVIESIGRRESYLALLLEYPGALEPPRRPGRRQPVGSGPTSRSTRCCSTS